MLDLEQDLANVPENDAKFRQLCKISVMCEDRWASLYCRDYNKPFESYRSEAISVLKHNLDVRRGDAVRPANRAGTGATVRQIRRDCNTVNPSVSIANGQIGNPQNV